MTGGQTYTFTMFPTPLQVITECTILHKICLKAGDLVVPEDDPEEDAEEDEGKTGLKQLSLEYNLVMQQYKKDHCVLSYEERTIGLSCNTQSSFLILL